MAQTWLALQGPPAGMRSLALTDPKITHTVGLVEPETDLVHPIVRALRDELSTDDVDTELAQRSRPRPQDTNRPRDLDDHEHPHHRGTVSLIGSSRSACAVGGLRSRPATVEPRAWLADAPATRAPARRPAPARWRSQAAGARLGRAG